MTITRAKATSLLNATEMGLYDDSRANALRGHTDAKLARLIIRARTARDRARDLEKRQRLASRSATGSKSGRSGAANARTGEKATLLSDILLRLETRQKDNAKSAKVAAKVAKSAKSAKAGTTSSKTQMPAKAATTSKRAPTKSAARGSTASKKATTDTVAKRAAVTRQAARKTAGAAATRTSGKTGSTKAASKAPAKSAPMQAERVAGRRATPAAGTDSKGAASKRGSRGTISPARALKSTKALLAQKDAEAAQGKTWEEQGDGSAQSAPGYQSARARSQALALHAAETRQASINGSISTRDRKNQGKRDHRNKPD